MISKNFSSFLVDYEGKDRSSREKGKKKGWGTYTQTARSGPAGFVSRFWTEFHVSF